MRIDADVRPTPCVDADQISCAQRDAFAGEQEMRVVHDPLQLREHVTRETVTTVSASSDAPAPRPATPAARRRRRLIGVYSSRGSFLSNKANSVILIYPTML